MILWKHDAEVLWAATGSILNSYISITLKQILNHERPSGLRSDPGMPSSHAQSIFYVSVFALLSCKSLLISLIITSSFKHKSAFFAQLCEHAKEEREEETIGSCFYLL